MPAPEKNEELTAAECASRTGLTVRALRVYEDYGLIAPRRSASGWRYYDSADLVRLNTIGLLKTAGLSLMQIRQVTILNERAPPLQHVLEMQVETWKERRQLAEHGQAVAETALQSLKANHSLSVDELCNLVRSLEMNSPSEPPDPVSRKPAVVVDEEILAQYAGQYRISEYALIVVTLVDGKLVAQFGHWPASELVPESNTEFYGVVSQARYVFQTDAAQQTVGVTISANGAEMTAPRVDAVTAEAINTGLTARIKSNAPVPGSEAALRRLIDGVRNGAPNYGEMSPQMERVVRKQLTQLQAMSRYLGSIQSIEFKGVGKQGWDIYEVHRENGIAHWRIALTDGVIMGAQASIADGP